MRLTQLVVQNFRMLRELKLDGLKALNVFIGPNATGKSTVLQAARLLLQDPNISMMADDCFRAHAGEPIIIEGTLSFDDRDYQDVAERAAYTGGRPNPPERVVDRISQILGEQVGAMFRVTAPRERGTAGQSIKQLRVDGDDLTGLLGAKLPRDDPWISGTRGGVSGLTNYLHAAFEEMMRAKSMFLPTGRNVASQFTGRRVEEISPGDTGPWMLQAKVEDRPELPEYEDKLKAFLPHLESLRTSLSSAQQGQFELGAVEEELPGTTPANRWSSGTLHLALTLLGLVGLPEGSVMLIEEPELSLHPYALRRLMDLVREAADSGRIQFFLTTHSPVVTEGIHPDEADHGLWRFSRKEDGSAEANVSTTEAEVAEAIDSLHLPEG